MRQCLRHRPTAPRRVGPSSFFYLSIARLQVLFRIAVTADERGPEFLQASTLLLRSGLEPWSRSSADRYLDVSHEFVAGGDERDADVAGAAVGVGAVKVPGATELPADHVVVGARGLEELVVPQFPPPCLGSAHNLTWRGVQRHETAFELPENEKRGHERHSVRQPRTGTAPPKRTADPFDCVCGEAAGTECGWGSLLSRERPLRRGDDTRQDRCGAHTTDRGKRGLQDTHGRNGVAMKIELELSPAAAYERATEALLDEVLIDAYGDDEQLWAIRQGFSDGLEFPLRGRVVGSLVEVLEFDYEGNDRRGLFARCTRDGETYEVSAADVVFEPGSSAALHVGAYRRWLGLEPHQP